MKSVFYVEEDFVASLLKGYFVGNGNAAQFIKRGANGSLGEQLSKNTIDLFLAQSEDPERLSSVLECVRQQARKVPTLVLTSQADRIPDKYKTFAHFISLQELLESESQMAHSACQDDATGGRDPGPFREGGVGTHLASG